MVLGVQLSSSANNGYASKKTQIAKYEYSQVIHNDRISNSNKPSDFGLLFTLTLHLYQTEPSF